MSEQDISEKLDKILAVVTTLRGQELQFSQAIAEAEREREEAAEIEKFTEEHRNNCQTAALMAWDIINESIWLMNAGPETRESVEWKRRREAFGSKPSEFLFFCREKSVWMDYEDPYYDPNQCNC